MKLDKKILKGTVAFLLGILLGISGINHLVARAEANTSENIDGSNLYTKESVPIVCYGPWGEESSIEDKNEVDVEAIDLKAVENFQVSEEVFSTVARVKPNALKETLEPISSEDVSEIEDIESEEIAQGSAVDEIPVFPFEYENLGEMVIVAHNSRSNGGRTVNVDGMTVTINPNIVPYGSIVYIEGIGFRYNQQGNHSDNTSNVYVYFKDEAMVDEWNGAETKVYLVHDDADLDVLESTVMHAKNLGDFRLTAYCPCSSCCGQYGAPAQGKYGALGTYVYEGTTIAVDPKVVPYGTLLYIEGVGLRFASDCGGAIKTNRIDVYFSAHADARCFGVQTQNVWMITV